jgi:hypothetical protein
MGWWTRRKKTRRGNQKSSMEGRGTESEQGKAKNENVQQGNIQKVSSRVWLRHVSVKDPAPQETIKNQMDILVYANKQDIRSALSVAGITECLPPLPPNSDVIVVNNDSKLPL